MQIQSLLSKCLRTHTATTLKVIHVQITYDNTDFGTENRRPCVLQGPVYCVFILNLSLKITEIDNKSQNKIRYSFAILDSALYTLYETFNIFSQNETCICNECLPLKFLFQFYKREVLNLPVSICILFPSWFNVTRNIFISIIQILRADICFNILSHV